jgi:hypothetical protein
MDKSDFFEGVSQVSFPWNDYQIKAPVFYRDFMSLSVSVFIPLKTAESILPSKRLKPYRVLPGKTILMISAYQYRDCDIGPYNEVGITIPVSIDTKLPLFTGSLRKPPAEPMAYFHSLPVSTEIARAVGAEFAGYPKFVADIDISEIDDWMVCELAVKGQTILTLKGRKLPLRRTPRSRVYPITVKDGRILRSEFVLSECAAGASTDRRDAELTFGSHPMAEELKGMNPGAVKLVRYCPEIRGILSPVLESFPA